MMEMPEIMKTKSTQVVTLAEHKAHKEVIFPPNTRVDMMRQIVDGDRLEMLDKKFYVVVQRDHSQRCIWVTPIGQLHHYAPELIPLYIDQLKLVKVYNASHNTKRP